MSCAHRHVVLVGSDETGLASATCCDCRAPLARRAEGGEYVYVRRGDCGEVAVVRADRRTR